MKYEIKKILVPIDFSDTAMIALDHAIFIAKKVNAEITLLHALEKGNFSVSIRKMLIEGKSLDTLEHEEVNKKFDNIKNTIGAGLNIKTKITEQDTKASKQITDVATELGVDLIVMGTHGAKGIENFIGGSNTYRVAGSAPCPVISVHGHSGNKGIKDIIVPIDSSPETREKIDHCSFIAQTFGSTVHLLAVTINSDEESRFKVKRIAAQVEEYLKADGIEVTTEFFGSKNITDSTLDYAKSKKADLIICMTEQELNSIGFFMGKYAQQMINHSDFPVMMVRPKQKSVDFVTPY